MSKAKKTLNKEEIQEKGLQAIQNYFDLDITKFDKNQLTHLHQKAKIGMQFDKEIGLSKRTIENNYIRVFKMVAEDKRELKKLINKSLPKYLK